MNQRMHLALSHTDFVCLFVWVLAFFILFVCVVLFLFVGTHTQEYGLMAVVFNIVKGIAVLFFHGDSLMYTPSTSVQKLPYLFLLASVIYLWSL